MVITWISTIVQKNFTVAIATSLDEIDFSARVTQRVYSNSASCSTYSASCLQASYQDKKLNKALALLLVLPYKGNQKRLWTCVASRACLL